MTAATTWTVVLDGSGEDGVTSQSEDGEVGNLRPLPPALAASWLTRSASAGSSASKSALEFPWLDEMAVLVGINLPVNQPPRLVRLLALESVDAVSLFRGIYVW